MKDRAQAAEAGKRKNGHGIIFFSLVLIIGLIIGLIAVLPQFYIKKITVEGQRRISRADLLQTANIEEGKHLFLYVSGSLPQIAQLHYGKTEENLLEHFPYLEEVDIRAVFPYEVRIHTKERVEVAYIKTKQEAVVIDRSGMVLEKLPLNETLSVPGIEGLDLGDIQPGQRIPEADKRAVDRALLVIDLILRSDKDAADDFSLMKSCLSFHPYSASTVYIQLQVKPDKMINVKLDPQGKLEEKISWLRNAFQQGALAEMENGILDLTGTQNYYSPHQTVPVITPPTTTATEPKTSETGTSGAEQVTAPAPTTKAPSESEITSGANKETKSTASR